MNSKYVKWRKETQISLISHQKDYSMSNLEQSKVQGNIKRQIQHALDPGLFSSLLIMMVQPLLWAWKGVRCKKPLDNYIIDLLCRQKARNWVSGQTCLAPSLIFDSLTLEGPAATDGSSRLSMAGESWPSVSGFLTVLLSFREERFPPDSETPLSKGFAPFAG